MQCCTEKFDRKSCPPNVVAPARPAGLASAFFCARFIQLALDIVLAPPAQREQLICSGKGTPLIFLFVKGNKENSIEQEELTRVRRMLCSKVHPFSSILNQPSFHVLFPILNQAISQSL